MSRGRNGAAGGAKGTRRATVATPAAVRGGKGRWSARRKMTVVLELVRGAELEATSRKYGVTAATLTRWREAFLEGGENMVFPGLSVVTHVVTLAHSQMKVTGG